MSQFAVYKNKSVSTRKIYPYLIDIQSDLLSDMRTTVVIPLCKSSQMNNPVISRLCPIVEIDDEKYIAFTPQLAGIKRNNLGKEVAKLSEYRSDFIAAIDLIISGI